ncbi:MAG: SLC13 family permease [Negativicutes bacterium]|nr:SLC13 family permease [Negativicutes bacterium]
MDKAQKPATPYWKNKKVIGGILGIVIALAIAFQTPPQGLSAAGLKAVAILCWAVTYWVFDVFPDYIVGMTMSILFVVCKVVPMNVAFATFSTDTWWILVSAIGLGAAATKTGLLTRISLVVLKIFPATFKGQVLALIGCGTLFGTLIPSTTAKMAIMAPLGLSISEALGFQKKSPGATGLFAAVGTGFNLSSPIFQSSSFLAYVLIAMLPQAMQAQFTWTYWFLCAATWGVVMLTGCILAIFYLYKPEEDVKLPPDFIENKIKELGAFTRDQKITLAVSVGALLLWMTQPIHNVQASIVALSGLCILLACNIYDRADFRKLILWDAIIFLGTVISLGAVFSNLKIDLWIGSLVGPVLAPFASNIYLYVIMLSVLVYLLRFVIVSISASVSVLALVFTPIAVAQGIHPFVAAFTVYCASNIWNVFYQALVWLMAYYATGGDMVEFSEIRKFSIAYMFISILGLVVSIPVWRFMGLL